MELSRRELLKRAAAIPVAARLVLTAPKPRIAVVGAGAFGGWTALQLRLLGAEVTLIDAWGPGNPRSSSGGETRVIRAIYGADRVYTEMVRRSYELWETLDPALYTETGALWLHRGDDAYVRSAVPVMKDVGFPVEKLELEDAARRWPQIDFKGVKSAWLEKRAGALSARRCCIAVRDRLTSYRTAHATPGPITGGRMASLILGDGSRVEADAYVFALGPWLGRVFPDVVGDRVLPTRQEVFYFGVPAGSRRYAAGQLPIWIDFGERIVYGIPDLDGSGFKVADDTRGEPFDPTNGDRTPTAAGVSRIRSLLSERFPELAKAPLIKAEVCQYENSPDGNLIVDRHPGASNVWLLGGGSGHGFKLAPAVGEIAASAIVSGKEVPPQFRLDREATRRGSQFDRKE